MTDIPLNASPDAFPSHVFDALGLAPRVREQRIGGSVSVLEKELPGGDLLILTAGVSRLPVDGGLPVELAVQVRGDQIGAALAALQIVCDDVAGNRRTPPVGSPWRNSEPFLRGTRISAIVATGSRWGAALDEVRDSGGTLLGHVRTLRLLTDAEAAVAAASGWDALVAAAGGEDALVDVERESAVAAPSEDRGAPAAPRPGQAVIATRLHEQHPPRWLTLERGMFQSVTGRESDEYMSDSANHEILSLATFVQRFPWTASFVAAAQEGQTALFRDASGAYELEA